MKTKLTTILVALALLGAVSAFRSPSFLATKISNPRCSSTRPGGQDPFVLNCFPSPFDQFSVFKTTTFMDVGLLVSDGGASVQDPGVMVARAVFLVGVGAAVWKFGDFAKGLENADDRLLTVMKPDAPVVQKVEEAKVKVVSEEKKEEVTKKVEVRGVKVCCGMWGSVWRT